MPEETARSNARARRAAAWLALAVAAALGIDGRNGLCIHVPGAGPDAPMLLIGKGTGLAPFVETTGDTPAKVDNHTTSGGERGATTSSPSLGDTCCHQNHRCQRPTSSEFKSTVALFN